MMGASRRQTIATFELLLQEDLCAACERHQA
eukprot:CAMPEP_0177185618 /NCGR_PEP_ID=MMETSP0367-20130122/18199_1 /TAXON_ID=447022 ORGANISM="Scrippsiella hangoei-like, Strain SHHI-4" /NCGR_SAMPLE_ID=MMETSP0367 /ASSEMBLY_ACC=CAM_ASM_000362 /LENGTH=30 /DNA_ID= /DNA_START= /DNA_END= /DNA_ORIENTATION=